MRAGRHRAIGRSGGSWRRSWSGCGGFRGFERADVGVGCRPGGLPHISETPFGYLGTVFDIFPAMKIRHLIMIAAGAAAVLYAADTVTPPASGPGAQAPAD